MTTDHVASRTLVKSPPELWAECSDAGSLARHIGEFGEITITRLEPETSVAWEGEHASGTVLIEPSGWGTRVTLTAQTAVGDHPVAQEDHRIAQEDHPVAQEADPVAQEDHPITQENDPVEEEEADETVEEAVAEPDHALAEDPGPVRRRWRRLIGRFRSRADDPAPAADELEPPLVVPEPELIAAAPGPELVAGAPEPQEPESVEPDPVDEEPEPEPQQSDLLVPPPRAADPAPPEPDDDHLDPEAILAAALDSLGQAHHRPFSRA